MNRFDDAVPAVNNPDWDVTEFSWESFPASDPPSWIAHGRDAESAAPGDSRLPNHAPQYVGVEDDGFVVDATLLAELFDLKGSDVRRLMHEAKITSICEHGINEHRDQFRLTFFHDNRRARIRVDASGRILDLSVINPANTKIRRTSDPSTG